jgi:hypothetical protein
MSYNGSKSTAVLPVASRSRRVVFQATTALCSTRGKLRLRVIAVTHQ